MYCERKEEAIMGFESFRVELRRGRTTYSQADETIQKQPYVRRDEQSLPTRGSTYYLIDDGRHVIEVELKDEPVRISCRFTLCHSPSVDAVFLALLRELMLRLGVEAWICDDVPPEDAHPFSLTEFAEFSTVALRSIAARRMEWIAAFGAEQMSATMNEVYKQIVLPQCQPLASWTVKKQE
jgi:hypothetical protein